MLDWVSDAAPLSHRLRDHNACMWSEAWIAEARVEHQGANTRSHRMSVVALRLARAVHGQHTGEPVLLGQTRRIEIDAAVDSGLKQGHQRTEQMAETLKPIRTKLSCTLSERGSWVSADHPDVLLACSQPCSSLARWQRAVKPQEPGGWFQAAVGIPTLSANLPIAGSTESVSDTAVAVLSPWIAFVGLCRAVPVEEGEDTTLRFYETRRHSTKLRGKHSSACGLSLTHMTAAMDAAVDTAEIGVASLVTKRVRALRKKLDKAVRAESSATEGKPLNVEQQALVSSKASLEALADELEKLRPALLEAVAAERAAERALAPPPVDPKLAESSSRKLAALQKVPSPSRVGVWARPRPAPCDPWLPVGRTRDGRRTVHYGGVLRSSCPHRPRHRASGRRPSPFRTRYQRGAAQNRGVGGRYRSSLLSARHAACPVVCPTRRSSRPLPLREIVGRSLRVWPVDSSRSTTPELIAVTLIVATASDDTPARAGRPTPYISPGFGGSCVHRLRLQHAPSVEGCGQGPRATSHAASEYPQSPHTTSRRGRGRPQRNTP